MVVASQITSGRAHTARKKFQMLNLLAIQVQVQAVGSPAAQQGPSPMDLTITGLDDPEEDPNNSYRGLDPVNGNPSP